MNSMTVKELKDLLRERGLPVSGAKKELIERLSEESGTEDRVERLIDKYHHCPITAGGIDGLIVNIEKVLPQKKSYTVIDIASFIIFSIKNIHSFCFSIIRSC